MKAGISTSIFWKSQDRILEHLVKIKNSGFEIIELDCHNIYTRLDRDSVTRLSAILGECRLSVNSVHMPYQSQLSSPDDAERELGLVTFRKLIEDISPLLERYSQGPVTLVFHPGLHASRVPRDVQKASFEKSVARMPEFIEDGRFVIAFENMLTSHFGAKKDELDFIVAAGRAAFRRSKVGICFDSCHCSYDYEPHEYLAAIVKDVVATHLSDNYNQPAGEFHAIPMSIIHSRMDWRRIMELLSEAVETVILELSKPARIRSETYLKMARLASDDLLAHIFQ